MCILLSLEVWLALLLIQRAVFKDSKVTLQVPHTLNPQEMGLLVSSVFVKALCVCFSLIVYIPIRLGQ